jgi:hypothetical protein
MNAERNGEDNKYKVYVSMLVDANSPISIWYFYN